MFLHLQNTTIGYATPLIEGVTTGLNLGEICLLIGNNGVGKTTLIKSILHQISVLKGEILLDKKNIKTLSNKDIAEQIAVVFSKTQVPGNLKVKDLISLGKYIHYPYYFELNESDEIEIENIIQDLGLSSYRDFNLQRLSDGNLQKAMIGRALAQNSPMIILDEPTAHLDEENKIIILQLLRKLAKEQNKLIFFSSHDWRLAKEFSDKIWFITEKKLYAGITEDILISHNELMNPLLFQFDKSFVAPVILAPDLQKEMLYSFLQKNFKTDLSSYKFTFNELFWEISTINFQHNAHSFEEILNELQKAHQ